MLFRNSRLRIVFSLLIECLSKNSRQSTIDNRQSRIERRETTNEKRQSTIENRYSTLGVRITEYAVRNTRYAIRGTEYEVRLLYQNEMLIDALIHMCLERCLVEGKIIRIFTPLSRHKDIWILL